MKGFKDWWNKYFSKNKGTGTQIPIMITRDMRQRFYDLNYTRVEVDSMLPSTAWEILKN